ncbi:MAG: MBL fold metallo-hydrolase [Oscillospiraceae bacterium]|nr:MBL fold metallo-hydrolase [Oscillospiraceae bacterium]
MINITALNLGFMGNNCYIVHDGKEAAVIDPGFEAETVFDAVKNQGLTLTKILLTHAHYDHIDAAPMLARLSGAKIYLHEDDRETLQHSGKINPSDNFVDVLLKDGDTINVGDIKIEVMHTPGHSKGSVCYLCGDAIFTGDTLFKETVGRTDLYGGNYGVLMESLKKLTSLEGDYRIFPGHESETTLEHERKYNSYCKG